MIDGTYLITVDSPLGSKEGTVVLQSEGATVIADIDAPIIGKQHVKGSVDGNAFSAEGSFKILFVGKINYTLTGEVVDDNLYVTIKSNKGDFVLEGTRL